MTERGDDASCEPEPDVPRPDAPDPAPAVDDGASLEEPDHRAPLWARLVGFAVTVALLAGLVLVVLARDRDRTEQSGTTGVTARTVALPPDNGGTITTTTAVPTPTGSGPTTIARQPRTDDEVALALERVLRRNSGFTYKASCQPPGPISRGEVLECSVASEPAVGEAPPGTVLAAVVDDEGKFVWTLAAGGDNTIDALRADPNLSCDDLAGRNKPWTYVLAYWLANGRPAALDPSGSGRPCDGRYDASDIDLTLAAAL